MTVAFDAIAGAHTGDLLSLLPPKSTVYVYGGLSEQAVSNIELFGLIYMQKQVKGFILNQFLEDYGAKKVFDTVQAYVKKGLFKTAFRKGVSLKAAMPALRAYMGHMSQGKVLILPHKETKTSFKKTFKAKLNKQKPRKKKAPIDLYYWPTPNGWKISIMLEECGLPYNLVPIHIGKGEQFKCDFLKRSPNNKIPALVDREGPDGKEISLFESGAILKYLAQKTNQFYAHQPEKQAMIDQWLFFQMANLGPMAGQAHHFMHYAPKYFNKQIPYAKKRYQDEVNRIYKVMDTTLKETRYIAGSHYSIADIALYAWACIASYHKASIDEMKHLNRWLAEVGLREAVQRGCAVMAEVYETHKNKELSQKQAKKLFMKT